jgi:hypothetical protein
VDGREELADVINALRRTALVARTKTLFVLSSWLRS